MEQFRKIDFEKEVLFYRTIVVVLLMLLILLPFLASYGVLKPANEKIEIWFQRSGSIIVLLGSLAEYCSFKMHNVFSPIHLSNEPLFNTKLKYCLQAKWLMVISAIFISFGTIVWGYGDLFYKNV